MSSVSSISATALVGAYGRFDAAASRLVQATSGRGPGDVVDSVVGLQQAKTGVHAAVAVTRAADEMTGTLLDLIA